MARDNSKDRKDRSKKKYVKPKMSRQGSLRDAAERVVGFIAAP